jgi:hypothetical protein
MSRDEKYRITHLVPAIVLVTQQEPVGNQDLPSFSFAQFTIHSLLDGQFQIQIRSLSLLYIHIV